MEKYIKILGIIAGVIAGIIIGFHI